MTHAPPSSLRCDYDEGMFRSPGCDAVIYYHEAGHAVTAYALGLGCVSIAAGSMLVGNGGGCVQVSKRSTRRTHVAQRRLRGRAATPADLHHLVAAGTFAAAGMAAERKLAFLLRLPVAPEADIRGGLISDGDHRIIEQIDKALCVYRGRWRGAFERLAWGAAQSAMDAPRIWGAVGDIAGQLSSGLWNWGDDGEARMHGPAARAIMRRHGVFPGMKWGAREPTLDPVTNSSWAIV